MIATTLLHMIATYLTVCALLFGITFIAFIASMRKKK